MIEANLGKTPKQRLREHDQALTLALELQKAMEKSRRKRGHACSVENVDARGHVL